MAARKAETGRSKKRTILFEGSKTEISVIRTVKKGKYNHVFFKHPTKGSEVMILERVDAPKRATVEEESTEE